MTQSNKSMNLTTTDLLQYLCEIDEITQTTTMCSCK